jgi:hypothetical protein
MRPRGMPCCAALGPALDYAVGKAIVGDLLRDGGLGRHIEALTGTIVVQRRPLVGVGPHVDQVFQC